MLPDTTPLTGNNDGEGWHLKPKRRFFFAALSVVGALILVGLARQALAEGRVVVAVYALLIAVPIAAVPVERQRSQPARMFESPTSYGLLLPLHPYKVSLVVCFALVAPLLLATPFGLVYAGTQGRLEGAEYVGAVLGSLVAVAVGLLFVAAAWGGLASRRSPNRGILLTIDGVVLRTQHKPASFGWHAVRGVRAHWRRQRSAGDNFISPEDIVRNWFTFEVDPAQVEGSTPASAFAGIKHPTLDASRMALDPELALAVCRFYLDDAEARGELRTTSALDRVASLARSRLETPGQPS